MTPQEEKVKLFLGQFGTEGEFVAWCEGQGVKGQKGRSTRCLMAQAIQTATGVPVAVQTLHPNPLIETLGCWRVRLDGSEYQEMPPAVSMVPWRFDLGMFPQLESPKSPLAS